jgi:hypothetical protein
VNSWTDLYAYHKGGQSQEQQTRDREECRKWATGQASYNPANPPADNKEAAEKRSSYMRAEAACLEARNYSVG